MRKLLTTLTILFLCVIFIGAGVAHAVKLEVSPNAPVWAHLGAAVLLYLHMSTKPVLR